MPVLRDERPPGGFKRPPVDARGPQRKKLQEIGRDKIGTRIVGESPEETPEGRSRTVDPEAGVFVQSCQIEAESDRLRGPASEQTPGYTAPPEEEDQPYWVDQGLRNAQEVLERGVGLARQREAKLVDRGYYGNQVPTASASQAGPEWEIAQFGMSAPVPTWPDPPAVMRQDGAGAPIGPGHTSTYLADKTHGHPSRAADSAVASMPPEPQPGAPPAHFRHERPSGGGPRTVPADGPRARPPQHGALARAGPTPQAQRRGPPQTRQQPPYLQVYDSEVRVPSYPQHPPPAQLPHHRGQQPQHPAQQQLPPGRQAQRPPYSEPQSQSPREGQVRPRAQLYQAEGPREKEMRDARIQLQYAAWFGKQGGDG
ncbi:MAG: hypothetical protein BJ554DRAFT_347 [Olpidium bornovanus]|uniref:Uncharacterized protein n=1 Tax=Olpidium bornovanus TaxID=278681 RepID=A0A8H7ZTP5_9FUNG|nr:MAG: hypothetical protein BJ554DRAFT_347 [Olpidium bornovanus]